MKVQRGKKTRVARTVPVELDAAKAPTARYSVDSELVRAAASVGRINATVILDMAAPRRQSPPGHLRAMRVVAKTFELTELVIPKRITDEEIGDALETIARLTKQGRPSWQIYVKLVATVLWIFAHAVRDAVKGSTAARAPSKKG